MRNECKRHTEVETNNITESGEEERYEQQREWNEKTEGERKKRGKRLKERQKHNKSGTKKLKINSLQL
jgi:hypothetical protein